MFSLKHIEKALVLLCFHAKRLKQTLVLLCFRLNILTHHWFYCVFDQKYWKSIGFTVFSLKKVEKPLVLLQKCKKVKNPLVLLWKISKKSKNHYKTCGFWRKRVVKPISGNGFGPWISNTRLDMLWGTLTAKLFREKLNITSPKYALNLPKTQAQKPSSG